LIRHCDPAGCLRLWDNAPCSRCWQPKNVVFEDVGIAYRAFLDVVLGSGISSEGLCYRHKEGLWTVTYDHGVSFEQIFAFGKTPGQALDALILKARQRECQ